MTGGAIRFGAGAVGSARRCDPLRRCCDAASRSGVARLLARGRSAASPRVQYGFAASAARLPARRAAFHCKCSIPSARGAEQSIVSATRLRRRTRVLQLNAHVHPQSGAMSFLERVAPGGASPPARRRLARDVSFWRRGRVGRPGVRPREILKIPLTRSSVTRRWRFGFARRGEALLRLTRTLIRGGSYVFLERVAPGGAFSFARRGVSAASPRVQHGFRRKCSTLPSRVPRSR